MNFRENFIKALNQGLRKGDNTFKQLARLYGYPQENGDNLCKKDYYRFLKSCHEKESLAPVHVSKSKLVGEWLGRTDVNNSTVTQQGIVTGTFKGSSGNNRDNSKTEIDLNKYNLTTFKIDKEGNVCDQWYKSNIELEPSVDIKSLFKEVLSETKLIQEDFIPKTYGNDKLLVINATDVHLNKKCFQENTTLDDQISTFKSAIGYSVEEAKNPNKILFIIGHDFLHSEFNNSTTKGTPQDTLESFEVLFKKALQVLIHSINYCSTIASTDVVLVNGNHAYAAELQLFSALEVYYEALNNNRVKLIGGKEDRKYYEYYDNSFMLIHDTKNKISDLPLVFSIEKPQMFIKKNKYILSGHLHSKKEVSFISSNENYGIEHIQCPSLAGTDKWHSDNIYVGNKQRMLSLLVDPHKGIVNHIIYNA